ncbi:hypothetical protein PLESTM_000527300 [Pleodorina starrii]|nr:hypothetical protein PLESTM_000527300 [Pleodorina starrii]
MDCRIYAPRLTPCPCPTHALSHRFALLLAPHEVGVQHSRRGRVAHEAADLAAAEQVAGLQAIVACRHADVALLQLQNAHLRRQGRRHTATPSSPTPRHAAQGLTDRKGGSPGPGPTPAGAFPASRVLVPVRHLPYLHGIDLGLQLAPVVVRSQQLGAEGRVLLLQRPQLRCQARAAVVVSQKVLAHHVALASQLIELRGLLAKLCLEGGDLRGGRGRHATRTEAAITGRGGGVIPDG